MQQEIKRWINSEQDYATGVALYQEHGTSNVLKRLFNAGFSSFNQEKLLQSLQDLLPADTPDPKPAAAPKPKEPKAKPAPAPSEPPKVNPADQELYLQLMKQRELLLDERTISHSRLDMVRTDEERLGLALRIHELVPQIRKLNHVRKLYLAHGCLPEASVPKPKLDESDKASLIQRRNNLRSSRSKLRKQTDKVEELEAIEQEIERLTTLINTQ